MISSMKLKLATLLDYLEEVFGRLSLLAASILQYLNRDSGQDRYCARHVPRPLQVGLGIFQVLTIAITCGVGGSSSSDLFWVCFYQNDHVGVQGFEVWEDWSLPGPEYAGDYDCCLHGLASRYPKRPFVTGYISVILSFTRIS